MTKEAKTDVDYLDVTFGQYSYDAFHAKATVMPDGSIQNDQEAIKAAMRAQGLLVVPEEFSESAMEAFYSELSFTQLSPTRYKVNGLGGGINAALRVMAEHPPSQPTTVQSRADQVSQLTGLMQKLLATAREKAIEYETPEDHAHHVNTVAVLTAAMALLAPAPTDGMKEVLAPVKVDPDFDPNRIDLENGKYTLIYDDKTAGFQALRGGEPWRDMTGDKMIFAMFDKIQQYRDWVTFCRDQVLYPVSHQESELGKHAHCLGAATVELLGRPPKGDSPDSTQSSDKRQPLRNPSESDWVLAVKSTNSPRWVSDGEGDPCLSHTLEAAKRYPTYGEARGELDRISRQRPDLDVIMNTYELATRVVHALSAGVQAAHPNVAIKALPDWVIAVDAVNGPCWVSTGEGDPCRTHRLEMAEKYSTENEARENMVAIYRQYPNRRYSMETFDEASARFTASESASQSGALRERGG